jgi:hypothetical protein
MATEEGAPPETTPWMHVAGQPILARRRGDFTRWEEHDAYQQALDRLLRDPCGSRRRSPRQPHQEPRRALGRLRGTDVAAGCPIAPPGHLGGEA